MLELAEVQAGQRVLDIATGIGEPALLAARIVGPAGWVVATDVSSRMLQIARERATALELTNVEFLEADADRLSFPEASFDAILCRWGVTSLPNPANTLTAIRRILKANCLFSTAVWSPGATSRPLASIAMAIASEMFGSSSSSPETPSPPSARSSLPQVMSHAGFADVHAEEMTLALEFESAGDCIQYLKDVSPEFAVLLTDRSPGEQIEFQQRVAAALRPYTNVDGSVRLPNVTTCAVGRR